MATVAAVSAVVERIVIDRIQQVVARRAYFRSDADDGLWDLIETWVFKARFYYQDADMVLRCAYEGDDRDHIQYDGTRTVYVVNRSFRPEIYELKLSVKEVTGWRVDRIYGRLADGSVLFDLDRNDIPFSPDVSVGQTFTKPVVIPGQSRLYIRIDFAGRETIPGHFSVSNLYPTCDSTFVLVLPTDLKVRVLFGHPEQSGPAADWQSLDGPRKIAPPADAPADPPDTTRWVAQIKGGIFPGGGIDMWWSR